jgi:hypothetical protein
MTQTLKSSRATIQPISNKFLFLIIVLIVLLGIGLYTSNTLKALRPATATISRSVLEDKYGLRVSLVAVTAAGGMVDVRLNVVDAKKATALLQDKTKFPRLWVNGRELNVSADTKSQPLKLEDNGSLFLLFPNSGNAVKYGTSVTILFGDTAIEPIEAR